MKTSVDHTKNQQSLTKTNPIYDMTLSKTGLSSFQPDDQKLAGKHRPWCFYFIIVYLILQTVLNAVLIYKVFTPQSLLSNLIPLDRDLDKDFQTVLKNNSQETKNLKSRMLVLQSQVDGLCGDGGQLHWLSSDLYKLNTSTQRLEGKLSNISLTPGPPGVKGQPGEKGSKGDGGVAGPAGPKGDLGPKGKKGDSGAQGPGVKGEKGDPGAQGSSGAKGDMGLKGVPGVTGEKGAKGVKGASGRQGPSGAAGPPGPKGSQGSPGKMGIKGQKGASGSSSRVPLICSRC